MSNELLTQGNAAASLDEFYLFLSNLTAMEYVRNFSKRVRKKGFCRDHCEADLEDFNLDGIRNIQSRCFQSPTHQGFCSMQESMQNSIRIPCSWRCEYPADPVLPRGPCLIIWE